MKKTNKILGLMVGAVALVGVSVMGTMAYLQDTKEVTNTFTVGKVEITLDEKDVDNSTQGKDRDTANSYKLIPGTTYEKDPIVHVAAGSEECWLFVKVENEIAGIEDASNTIATQMAAKGWSKVGDTDVYAYREAVAAGANVPVFEKFKIAGTVESTALAAYEEKTIKVTAYAVQKENFNDAATAWSSTFGKQ